MVVGVGAGESWCVGPLLVGESLPVLLAFILAGKRPPRGMARLHTTPMTNMGSPEAQIPSLTAQCIYAETRSNATKGAAGGTVLSGFSSALGNFCADRGELEWP